MCISPVRIRNPNKGCTAELLVKTTDCVSAFINVPCGVCCECIAKKQSDLVQRCRIMSLDHYIFFYTLTYNNESLPKVKCSNGFEIPYADHSDIRNMFKRIRKANSFGVPFSYVSVSERGKSGGRPHFHGLIFVRKHSDDDLLLPAIYERKFRNVLFHEWRRNYGSTRNPDWKPLFTYRSKVVGGIRYSNFDLHFVSERTTDSGSTDVAFYVTKYILKPSDKEVRLQQALRLNLNPDEYDDIWKIVKSRCTKSLNFGNSTPLEESFVRSQIASSNTDPNGLHFKNPDGSLAPLPRFYRKYVTADDALKSVAARGGPLAIREREFADINNSINKSNIRLSKVADRDISPLTTID